MSTERTAWEDPSVPFPSNFASSWWESLTRPASFYGRLGWDDPVSRPLLYFLIATVGGAAFSLVWRLVGVGGALSEALLESTAEMAGDSGGLAAELLAISGQETTADLVLDFFLEPFVQLTVLLISVLVVHLFVAILASERRGLGATLRLACYAGGPALLTIVPFVGATVAWVWSIVLTVIGVSAAHRTSVGRATAIVLLPLFIGIMVISALTVMLIVFAAAMLPGVG